MANETPIGKIIYSEQVTAGANLAAKTIVNASGTVPANGAVGYGAVLQDVANGDIADVVTVGLVPVIAGGTCTKGGDAEVIQVTTLTTKDSAGVANVTGGAVQDRTSTHLRVGRFHTGTTTTGDVVLVELIPEATYPH